MRRSHAFTLVEAIVLIIAIPVIVAAVLLLLAPFQRHNHSGGRPMQNNTQLRGIHQAMVMYAQGNGGYFPGLDAEGNDKAVTVEERLQILLENNYFPGDYLVSPSETKTAWTTGTLTTAQYSYALLQLPAATPEASNRRAEWYETLNTQAPVASDRAIRTDGRLHSVHTEPDEGWRGSVAYNDNHVVFESTHRLPTTFGVRPDGIPASQAEYPADDLFTAAGDDDAYLIHTGND